MTMPSSSTCDEHWERVNDLLDERVDPRSCAEVRDHWRACVPCGTDISRMLAMVQDLEAGFAHAGHEASKEFHGTTTRKTHAADSIAHRMTSFVCAAAVLMAAFLLLAQSGREERRIPDEKSSDGVARNDIPTGRSRILMVRPIDRMEGSEPSLESQSPTATRMISVHYTNSRRTF